MSKTFHGAGSFDGPELNIGNVNASILSQLLQLQSDEIGCGSVEVDTLSEKIALAESEMKYHAREWERDHSDSINSRGVRFIDLPLSEQQILQYFIRLKEIVVYAKQHNVKIEWC